MNFCLLPFAVFLLPSSLATVVQVDPHGNVSLFGIHLIGFNRENGKKLLMTLCLIAAVVALAWLLRGMGKLITKAHRTQKVVFWFRQAINLLLALILLVGIVSIWFSEGARLATFLGLLSAGVAFALQKPISAFAGYIVILRGKTFNIGDRIFMGGVRGDVIELGFIQTTIMEMGQAPAEQQDDPSMWVHARQYTGRVVTVSNSQVFDEPVYNYTREFPYMWDEMRIPISYKDDRRTAEKILLDVANRHTIDVQHMTQEAKEEMERRFFTKISDLHPRVYWRLTDNWVELTVRFITTTHHIRERKDQMSRDILEALDQSHIGIASSTYDVVGMPPLRVQIEGGNGRGSGEHSHEWQEQGH